MIKSNVSSAFVEEINLEFAKIIKSSYLGLDCTFGFGNHTNLMLENRFYVISIERDERFCHAIDDTRAILLNTSASTFLEFCVTSDIFFDCIVFDIGLNYEQETSRKFSYKYGLGKLELNFSNDSMSFDKRVLSTPYSRALKYFVENTNLPVHFLTRFLTNLYHDNGIITFELLREIFICTFGNVCDMYIRQFISAAIDFTNLENLEIKKVCTLVRNVLRQNSRFIVCTFRDSEIKTVRYIARKYGLELDKEYQYVSNRIGTKYNKRFKSAQMLVYKLGE